MDGSKGILQHTLPLLPGEFEAEVAAIPCGRPIFSLFCLTDI